MSSFRFTLYDVMSTESVDKVCVRGCVGVCVTFEQGVDVLQV
jgi:hypothetical protein